MGLNIRAIRNIKRCDIQTDDVLEMLNDVVHVSPDDDMIFNQSYPFNGYYTYNECFSFRVGPYSSYNKWRKMLAEMLGHDLDSIYKSIHRDTKINEVIGNDETTNIPFIELLYFSDCDGCIGSIASSKLYKDFVDYREMAFEFSKDRKNTDWLSLYDDFLKSFKIASNDGVVEFC